MPARRYAATMLRLRVEMLLVLSVLVGSFGGCATVRPWQRQQLATAVMSESERPGEAMCERTFLESREGATGGSSVGAGGGCACN